MRFVPRCDRMKRRSLLCLAGAAWVTRSAWAQASPSRVYRVAIPIPAEPPPDPHPADLPHPSMRAVLASHGFGQNLRIEQSYLGAFPSPEVRAAKLREVVRSAPDVIFVGQAVNVLPLAKETTKIPIVFFMTSDLVVGPVVKELRRPGGNATGVLLLQRERTEKKVELAREMVPRGRRLAVLARYDALEHHTPGYFAEIRDVVARAGLELVRAALNGAADEAEVAARMARAERAEAWMLDGVLPIGTRTALHELSIGQRIPLVGDGPKIGVASVGMDLADHARRAAEILARVLKGADPATIPVDRDTRLVTTVNPEVAKAIGLDVPPAVLIRAERTLAK
jgi:putative tryptophan/tyrosine transport system substrate-binding protein